MGFRKITFFVTSIYCTDTNPILSILRLNITDVSTGIIYKLKDLDNICPGMRSQYLQIVVCFNPSVVSIELMSFGIVPALGCCKRIK